MTWKFWNFLSHAHKLYHLIFLWTQPQRSVAYYIIDTHSFAVLWLVESRLNTQHLHSNLSDQIFIFFPAECRFEVIMPNLNLNFMEGSVWKSQTWGFVVLHNHSFIGPLAMMQTSLEPMPSAQFCFASPACSTDSWLAGGSAPWNPGDYILIAKYIVYPTEPHISYPSEPPIVLHPSIYIFSSLNQTNYITTQKFKQN